jgi:hypothetical protein
MTRAAHRVRVEDLVGRKVRTKEGRVVGRIEEMRAERREDGECEVLEFHLGAGALLERWAIAPRAWFGWRAAVLVARWDQVDISRPETPVLTCAPGQLWRMPP